MESKTSQEVRAWALANGVECTRQGPLPERVRQAWEKSFGVSLYIEPSRNTLDVDGVTGDPVDDAYWQDEAALSRAFSIHLRNHEDVYLAPECMWCEDEAYIALPHTAYLSLVDVLVQHQPGKTPESASHRARQAIKGFLLSYAYPIPTDPAEQESLVYTMSDEWNDDDDQS